MSVTLDPPTSSSPPPSRTGLSEFGAGSPAPAPPNAPQRKKNWLERYHSHVLIAGLSVLVTAIALSPLMLGSMSRSTVTDAQAPAQTRAVAPTNLATNIALTASEFKFSPSTVQVPVGQRVTFTLSNTGVVEHDITVQNTAFSLRANAGQNGNWRVHLRQAWIV